MEKASITARQRDCYNAIVAHMEKHDESPSIEELREATGLKAKSGVLRLLDGLEERGWIRRLPHRARTIVVVQDFERINLKDPLTKAYLVEQGWLPPLGQSC